MRMFRYLTEISNSNMFKEIIVEESELILLDRPAIARRHLFQNGNRNKAKLLRILARITVQFESMTSKYPSAENAEPTYVQNNCGCQICVIKLKSYNPNIVISISYLASVLIGVLL